MGNCLSGLAFKQEGLEEEPNYERVRPKPRATSSREYSELSVTLNSKSTQAHIDDMTSFFDEAMRGYDQFGDVFEPRTSDVNIKEQADPVSKTVEVKLCAGPIHSEDAAGTAMEGILNALTDLELGLNKRTDWLNKAKVDEKEVPKQEEEMPSEDPNQKQDTPLQVPEQEQQMPLQVPEQAQQMPLQVPDQPQEMPLQVPEIPDPPQVTNKTTKREFRKRQHKAKKRRISLINPADSSDEASNSVDSDWLSSADVGGILQPPAQPNLKVPKHKFRTAKRSPSFHHIKPQNRFKNIANKRSHQAVNIKNQIRCVPLKIKAE